MTSGREAFYGKLCILTGGSEEAHGGTLVPPVIGPLFTRRGGCIFLAMGWRARESTDLLLRRDLLDLDKVFRTAHPIRLLHRWGPITVKTLAAIIPVRNARDWKFSQTLQRLESPVEVHIP